MILLDVVEAVEASFTETIKWPKGSFLNRVVIEVQLLDHTAYNLRVRNVTFDWQKYKISVEMWENLLSQFENLPGKTDWKVERFPILKDLFIFLKIPDVVSVFPKKQTLWLWEEHPKIKSSVIMALRVKA